MLFRSTKATLDITKAELESLKEEYNNYKESMKPYEEMSAAEAEAAKLAAEQEAERIKAEEAAKAEAEAAARAAEEAKGYETGITYDQLARTPDEYKGKKVKFTGRVVQLIENDSEINIRLAVDDNYDTIIFGGYDPSIVSSRVLEEDVITIYGNSIGLYSYESTLGGKITVPGIWIEKIDQ